MRYVTIDEMRSLDHAAIIQRGIAAATLMERAGAAVADAARAMVKGGPVVILCGYGNNGGDGFVAARLLVKAGYRVQVFLVGNPRGFSPETYDNVQSLSALGIEAESVMTVDGLERIADALTGGILVIDAIFGVGVRGPLDEFYATLIGIVNESGRPVIAVDVPSGLDADTGKPLPVAIKAAKTVTMGYPKIGFQLQDAKEYIGELTIADIGV